MKVKVISLPYIFQVLYVLYFTRPRHQVSVYRTIGPGSLFFLFSILKGLWVKSAPPPLRLWVQSPHGAQFFSSPEPSAQRKAQR